MHQSFQTKRRIHRQLNTPGAQPPQRQPSARDSSLVLLPNGEHTRHTAAPRRSLRQRNVIPSSTAHPFIHRRTTPTQATCLHRMPESQAHARRTTPNPERSLLPVFLRQLRGEPLRHPPLQRQELHRILGGTVATQLPGNVVCTALNSHMRHDVD